ncbi:MAG: sulfatase [Acidobacteria bacterium]|nr:sulfatase [Acidobacteriota bacterium]
MQTRRQFLASSAVLAAQKSTRPNILFLLGDDQRWDTLGCMGNKIIKTPHIDRLAARGTIFDNCFVTTSICATSRASIFTGQYARTHGVNNFSDTFKPGRFELTYPQLMRAAGYRSGFIGKYGVGDKMPSSAFDYWKGFPGQGKYFPQGEPGPHLTDIMGDQALDFMQGGQQPWCLSISFKAGHVQDEDPRQFLPSPKTATMYEGVKFPEPKTMHPRYIAQMPPSVQRSENRRRWVVRFGTPALYQESVRNYYRLLSEIDMQVGRMVEFLTRTNQIDNTVIVYSGDNGFYLGEHGLAGKWFLHEESIRVPLLVIDPRTRGGLRRSETVLNIDIAPTLLAAAGLPAAPGTQGRNLLPLTRGDGAPNWRTEFFYEHLLPNAWIPRTEGVRTNEWMYCRFLDENPVFEELYNLKRDPLEENNLASDPSYRTQLDTMRGKWRRWREHLERYDPATPFREV